MTPHTLIRIAACSIVFTFITSAPAADGDATTEAEMKAYRERIGKHLEFVPIKGGKFLMGSPKDEPGRKDDEGPQFEVVIEPLWIGKFEVTWDDFEEFHQEYVPAVVAKGWTIPKDREADAVSIPTLKWGQEFTPILNPLGEKGGFPVADLSRFNAMQFTKWLSKKTGRFYRLPTEAEWEYAARAGSKTAYYWGDKSDGLEKVAIFFDNSDWNNPVKGFPAPGTERYSPGTGYRVVGARPANPWGLHDMYGNVAEWVIDAYDANHYAKFAGKTVSWKDAINWPTTSTFPSVYRGGDFSTDASACRSASREASDMKKLQDRDTNLPKSPWWYSDAFHIGIRVVRPLKEPTEEEKALFWDSATNLKEVKAVWDTDGSSSKQYRKVIEPLPKQ